MRSGLKSKFLVVVLLIFIGAAGVAFLVFQNVTGQVAGHLGSAYAGKYALANRALVEQPLEREIALARQMGDSPAIRKWAEHEEDPALRAQAFAELESYRGRLAEHSWFYVVGSSRNYYYDDPSHRYGPAKIAYTLSQDISKDAWYFATLRDVKDYALNVNYDRVLDTRKVWINVVVREPDGRPIAMVGSGLDLSGFLRQVVDQAEPGVDNILIDRRSAIQAHRNRDLIDLQSVAKPDAERSRIDRQLTGGDDGLRLQAALERLRGGGSTTESLFVTIGGKRQLLGAVYLPGLDWYSLTVVDLDAVIRRHVFTPVFSLVVIMAFVLIGIVGWVVNRMVLTPVAALTAASQRIADGDFTLPALVSSRNDEIGMLTRSFAQMSERVREERALLELRVQERTAQLDDANQVLQKRATELEKAVSDVRTLSAMLPICCSCRKIRDDKGYWSQLEQYVEEHTGTEFSHGLCPDCAQKLFPDYREKS